MNTHEYANMARMENAHWYYVRKRDFTRTWLLRVKPQRRGFILLGCGSGTGRFAQKMEINCQIMAPEGHKEALKLLPTRFKPDQILSLAGDRVPPPDGSLGYITALDVSEHTPDDQSVIDGFRRLLKPGDVALVTVPASMALWSVWDLVLHRYRRYSRPQLRALFSQEKWTIVHANYTNVFIYPLAWLLRKWRKWFPGSRGQVRAEDKLPTTWLNVMLRWAFARPAFWRLTLPFGVSLLLVAQRR